MIDRLTVFLTLAAFVMILGSILFGTLLPIGVADKLCTKESGDHLGSWSDCPEGYDGSGDLPRECRTGQVDLFFARYAVIQRREMFGDFPKFNGTVVGIFPDWLRIALTLAISYLMMEGVVSVRKKTQQPTAK